MGLGKYKRLVGRAFEERAKQQSYIDARNKDRKECAHCSNYYFGRGVVCTPCYHRITSEQLDEYYDQARIAQEKQKAEDAWSWGCALIFASPVFYLIFQILSFLFEALGLEWKSR